MTLSFSKLLFLTELTNRNCYKAVSAPHSPMTCVKNRIATYEFVFNVFQNTRFLQLSTKTKENNYPKRVRNPLNNQQPRFSGIKEVCVKAVVSIHLPGFGQNIVLNIVKPRIQIAPFTWFHKPLSVIMYI